MTFLGASVFWYSVMVSFSFAYTGQLYVSLCKLYWMQLCNVQTNFCKGKSNFCWVSVAHKKLVLLFIAEGSDNRLYRKEWCTSTILL